MTQRLLATVTLIAFAIAGVMRGDHEAAVTHVRCEHGELTHAANVRVVAGGQRAVTELPAQTESHDHEHCLLACALHALAKPRFAIAIAAFAAIEPIATATPIAIHARGAVYRTAPKTSPPA